MKAIYTLVAVLAAACLSIALTACGGGVSGSSGGGGSTQAEKPTIGTQPASQSVVTGSSATFTVATTGSAMLTYQWKKNGTDISGATNSSYTTPPTTSADDGAQFSVVVSNSAGSTTSSDARLGVTNVPVAPAIGKQPENQSVVTGASASFSVTAAGTSPSYQWKKNGSDISGAISSTYTMLATSLEDNGALFTVVVSNTAGTVTSNEGRLAVSPPAPTIGTQPAAQTVAPGKTATFSVTASGTGELHYQWRKYGANIDGATLNSYTTPATTSFDNGAPYSVVVTDSLGNTVTSSNATLIVSQYSLVVKASGGTYDITECVKDNGTGLIWEGKTDSGDRAGSNTYTNYDRTDSLQKTGNPIYVNPTAEDIAASTNSIGYATSANAGSGLCGFTDWRMPTKVELEGILNARQATPKIDSTWFPNTQAGKYWTKTPNTGNTYSAWYVNFSDGVVDWVSYRDPPNYYVRLVRGTQ
ncbi:MAG: DUF1566 domain-containing protein [Rhodoferax sp.]|nr:DUF1566 domain-containing protein [Rhodoferax sp.]